MKFYTFNRKSQVRIFGMEKFLIWKTSLFKIIRDTNSNLSINIIGWLIKKYIFGAWNGGSLEFNNLLAICSIDKFPIYNFIGEIETTNKMEMTYHYPHGACANCAIMSYSDVWNSILFSLAIKNQSSSKDVRGISAQIAISRKSILILSWNLN